MDLKLDVTLVGHTYKDCYPVFQRYNDGSLAIQLHNHEDPAPICTVTSNLGTDPNDDVFWVKDYSENEGLVQQLVDAGWIELTGKTRRSGYVEFPEASMTGTLLEIYNEWIGRVEFGIR